MMYSHDYSVRSVTTHDNLFWYNIPKTYTLTTLLVAESTKIKLSLKKKKTKTKIIHGAVFNDLFTCFKWSMKNNYHITVQHCKWKITVQENLEKNRKLNLIEDF